MHWTYNGKRVDSLPEGVIGFVYCIYYEDGTKYLGKKKARSQRKKHFGKKKLATVTDKRLKTYEYVDKDLPWQDYEGSSKEIPNDLRIHSKVILHLCTSLTTLTWLEVKEMVFREVLTDINYHNKNILGKFWDNCEEGIYSEQVLEQKGLFDEEAT